MEQLQEVIVKAIEIFKKRYNAEKLEDGDEFVTILNNCTLVICYEDGNLQTRFIGGEVFKIDESLDIYEED